MPDDIILDTRLKYLSKDIDKVIRKMWREFYHRLAAATDYNPDRALWVTPYSLPRITVFPGSPTDPDDLNRPPFWITVFVDDFQSLRDRLLDECESEDEWLERLQPLNKEYRDWINPSIVRVWKSDSIQRLHRKARLPYGRFGIYSTDIPDIAPWELEEMQWLAGDRL